jgi:hypothetical protein
MLATWVRDRKRRRAERQPIVRIWKERMNPESGCVSTAPKCIGARPSTTDRVIGNRNFAGDGSRSGTSLCRSPKRGCSRRPRWSTHRRSRSPPAVDRWLVTAWLVIFGNVAAGWSPLSRQQRPTLAVGTSSESDGMCPGAAPVSPSCGAPAECRSRLPKAERVPGAQRSRGV